MSEQNWNRDTGDVHEQVTVVQEGNYEQRQEVVENYAAARQDALIRVTQLVWLLLGLVNGLIGLRVLLKLIGANPASPFAALIYRLTDVFLWPFFGLTAVPQFNNFVLEIPSIIAMLVYALLAWVLVKVLWLLFNSRATRTVTTYERERRP